MAAQELSPRYDRIGTNYSRKRRPDPAIAALIDEALGDARTVVNVGAGAGSYEPADRHVVAIEPSDVMASQRPAHLAPAIRGTAGKLPLRDASVDAAMAILTLHHWDYEQEWGVRELRRVARGPVVLLTIDPRVSERMWLFAEYLPEVADLDRSTFPVPERLGEWLGGHVRTHVVELARDTPDGMLASFWAHPERVLDPDARAATSGFARMQPAIVDRCVAAVERDLASGAWDARHGALRSRAAYDVGLRLIVAR
jgi:SAM-dependent methyltransferase